MQVAQASKVITGYFRLSFGAATATAASGVGGVLGREGSVSIAVLVLKLRKTPTG
jgi:hypothetical protein